jgi:hypothetical protein
MVVVCGGVFGASLFVAAGWYFVCDWVPNSVTQRLPGATRDDVHQLLGEPVDYRGGSRGTADVWIYDRPGRLAEFQVHFDSSGRVEGWYYDR